MTTSCTTTARKIKNRNTALVEVDEAQQKTRTDYPVRVATVPNSEPVELGISSESDWAGSPGEEVCVR